MAASYVGLYLAQPQESTALAVLTRQVVSRETTYSVRHLQRWQRQIPAKTGRHRLPERGNVKFLRRNYAKIR